MEVLSRRLCHSLFPARFHFFNMSPSLAPEIRQTPVYRVNDGGVGFDSGRSIGFLTSACSDSVCKLGFLTHRRADRRRPLRRSRSGLEVSCPAALKHARTHCRAECRDPEVSIAPGLCAMPCFMLWFFTSFSLALAMCPKVCSRCGSSLRSESQVAMALGMCVCVNRLPSQAFHVNLSLKSR